MLNQSFFGYKPDWIKYLDSATGLGSDWITHWKYWTGLGTQKSTIRSTLVQTLHAPKPVLPLIGIVDLTFRITNCRFPTRDCIPYVRSGLSQLAIRVKGFRVCALHCVRANDLDFAFCIGSFWRGHHVFRESNCVSLAHGPRLLFLLSRHRKAFLLLLIRSLLYIKICAPGNLWNELSKWWEPNALLRLGKCQAVLVGS